MDKIDFSNKIELEKLPALDENFCPAFKILPTDMIEEVIEDGGDFFSDSIIHKVHKKGECFCSKFVSDTCKGLQFKGIDEEKNIVFRCQWDFREIIIKPIAYKIIKK